MLEDRFQPNMTVSDISPAPPAAPPRPPLRVHWWEVHPGAGETQRYSGLL